jgi:hypothetical protein
MEVAWGGLTDHVVVNEFQGRARGHSWYTFSMPTLLIGAPTQRLAGIDVDLRMMAGMLPACGLDAPIIVHDATLAEIRIRLAELLTQTIPGAPVLLYLTGHGGYVVNREHDFREIRPAPQRLYYFRTTPEADGQDEALFDVELSLWCARIAARTANIVVVVDCCHASGMVRDDVADQAFVAAFESWRAAHQDEIEELEAEAHADVIRLSAAGANGFARASEGGSALTTSLLAALAEPGALRSSWFGLFARIEAHMAMAGVAQSPRLSGPVRRQVFTLVEGLRAEGIDEGVAQVGRLLQGGGVAIGALDLRVTWGRARYGVCEPLIGPAVEVCDDEPLYVRVANVGDARRFVGVFWVSSDGEVVLLSRSESMGIELDGRTVYVLGDRPFARAPRGVTPPRRRSRPGERRGERLVVVGASRRQALWSAVTGGDGRRTAEVLGVEILHFTVVARESMCPS